MFISDCAENMGQFFPLVDIVILLSAPVVTLMERLETRPLGSYGHVAEERRKVANLTSTIEPVLRQSADYEIDTRRLLNATVNEVLRLSGRA